MFNVAVLKLKDIIKYFFGIMLLIISIVIITKCFPKLKENTQKMETEINIKKEAITNNSFVQCLDKTLAVVNNVNKEYSNIANEKDEREEKDIFEEILKNQLSSIKGIEKIEEKQEKLLIEQKEQENLQSENNSNSNEKNEQENIEATLKIAQTGLNTEVITNNPIAENANVQYGNVKIKNQTSYQLTNEMLTPDITIENKNIILFHTHSCESYTASELYQYTPTGTFRTTDLNFTVTRVGTELENQLKQYNYNVIHNTDYHDYPAYNG